MTPNSTARDRSSRVLRLDTAVPRAMHPTFDAFQDAWQTHLDNELPMPAFSQAAKDDYRGRTRVAQVRDVMIVDAHPITALQTLEYPDEPTGMVKMYTVRRGTWTLGGSPVAGERTTISAGQFLLHHMVRPTPFETTPDTIAKILVLPASALAAQLADRTVIGEADSAEVRLLTAHTSMVTATLEDLGPAGVDAAHRSLLELAKAVAAGRFDDAEPLLAPALTQAAKDLADERLGDRELSPTMLARELRVSPRTLQRAFAAAGEPAGAYIRRRRLEQARLALGSPGQRASITEIAAYWHFTDSSHFARSFKAQFGQTPSEYARVTRPGPNIPSVGRSK
uniref:helix-turn-helix domain-containing protein n=1 Tax=Paractinoplanes polyasparticus TaxID=2856853 RepID=UPI001C84EBCA|nr:helix-turn-helix domain-containing protein [Actinoplanes polyasparticus]